MPVVFLANGWEDNSCKQDFVWKPKAAHVYRLIVHSSFTAEPANIAARPPRIKKKGEKKIKNKLVLKVGM